MRIVIFSRGAGLYSTQSLLRAGLRRRHQIEVVDHLQCSILIEERAPRIYYGGLPLGEMEAVIPRIGASVTFHGASLIRQVEAMKIFTATRAEALIKARDKLRCLQQLAIAGVQVPKTFFLQNTQDLPSVLEWLGGAPVVVKLLESTHGVGVILAESRQTAVSVVEAFIRTGEKVLVQEFIKEAEGSDVRAFVVGGQIVAAMKRQALAGEFRSNLHRGATAEIIRLSDLEERVVKKAVQVMGLHIAGVDLLRSRRGPLVMEVNASPGLEGIETITGVDIAGRIIEFVENGARRLSSARTARTL